MNNPNEEYLEAVYRILRYLKMIPGKGLFFGKSNKRSVEIYSDADWAGSITDRRSTTGYCSYVWGNLITWRSKKQAVVARSSAEAEYRALAQGICEEIWLVRVLKELRVEIWIKNSRYQIQHVVQILFHLDIFGRKYKCCKMACGHFLTVENYTKN